MSYTTLTDERLAILHAQIKGATKRQYEVNRRRERRGEPAEPAWLTVDAFEVGRALGELILRRQKNAPEGGGFALSETTKTLMTMRVGDTVIFPPMTQSALSTNRNTARKRMGIPDARWHGEILPDNRVRVTRMPDGSPHLYGNAGKSPAVQTMAGMAVDDVVTVSSIKGPLHSSHKQQARKLMGKDYANWKATRLANGTLRITRVR
jgi:hypothetical protein